MSYILLIAKIVHQSSEVTKTPCSYILFLPSLFDLHIEKEGANKDVSNQVLATLGCRNSYKLKHSLNKRDLISSAKLAKHLKINKKRMKIHTR